MQKRVSATAKLLGMKISNLSAAEINDWIKIILSNPPEQRFVVSLNPEIILKGHCDEGYKKILSSADLALCDGFGVKCAAWLKGEKIKTRYTGVDLVERSLKLAKENNISALVVVSKNSLSSPEEIEKGIRDKYDFGARAKYWDDERFFECEDAKKAEIVFVNFGAPHQEKFIFENKRNFPKAKFLAGVGGTFDFLTGKIRRAPQWMRKAGLEWFWRMLQEPKRLKRIINAVVVFPWVVLINKKNK